MMPEELEIERELVARFPEAMRGLEGLGEGDWGARFSLYLAALRVACAQFGADRVDRWGLSGLELDRCLRLAEAGRATPAVRGAVTGLMEAVLIGAGLAAVGARG